MTGRRVVGATGATVLVLVLVLALGLGACAPSPSPALGPGPASSQARIGLLEWGFTSSASALVAGPVELEVTNAGSTAHDMQVVVGDEVLAGTRVLRPGETQVLRADLTGVDEVSVLLCTLPGHRAQGMVDQIEVVASAETTTGGDRP